MRDPGCSVIISAPGLTELIRDYEADLERARETIEGSRGRPAAEITIVCSSVAHADSTR